MIVKQRLHEDTRPTLYRGLKYWGKKPHNVWRRLIEDNTQPKDVVYDPFAGSALTFFESLKAGRVPVIADINPLTLFLVDVYSKSFDLQKIKVLADQITTKIRKTAFYKKNYTCECPYCHKLVEIYNYRWHNGTPDELSYKCPHCRKTYTIRNTVPYIQDTDSKKWKPSFDLRELSLVTPALINKIGGSNITHLWTNRNLTLLCAIFDHIRKIKGEEKDALMFGFMQILHLTTKMCALRGNGANRPLSTSWGRPAFLGLSSFMEQNPVVQFERAIYGNAGVIQCLESRYKYLPSYTYSTDIKDLHKVDGIVLLRDCKAIKTGFHANLVITDPPYGSIIQYGELSLVWNVWLNQYDPKYAMSLKQEIIVNRKKNHERYVNDMVKVWNNCQNLLEQNANVIVTYNSNSMEDWQALQQILQRTDLYVKEQRVQKNKRSSEANVSCKKGIGITDYYFVLGTKKR